MRWLRQELALWRRDTFSKRLFLLLWVTLVASHLLGFTLLRPTLPAHDPGPGAASGALAGPAGARHGPDRGGPPADAVQRLVVPPFLPPHALPGLDGGPPGQAGPPPWQGEPGRTMRPPGGLQGGPPFRPPHEHGLPWLEYLARIGVLGVGAWLGARWLTAPMRKLAAATQALNASVTGRGELPQMDERSGPIEVRQTAQAFNHMARQLRDQFEQRSLMMAAVSHDLRTPLTRLRMRLERLQPDPEVARCVADVQDINAMINAVLDAMNEERRHEAPVLVDVWSLVQALADDLQEAGQPVTAAGSPATIQVPPVGLRRVLDNLVGNALRYGHSAAIGVCVREAEPGEWPGRPQRWVDITVDDTGPGIAPAHLDAVFKPFYRVDASRGRTSGDQGGSGLGLYIARELVDRAGGHIRLSNLPGGGLRATVSYPAA